MSAISGGDAVTLVEFWFGGTTLYIIFPSWIAFLSIPLPDWVRLIMVGVTALSIPFTLWAYRTLRISRAI